MTSEAEAQAIFEQAQKKSSTKSSGLFGSIFGAGGSASCESAVELYVKAGNMFKISKSWEKAGNSFKEAATINLNVLKNTLDATQNFIEAGNCYRKENYKLAVTCYKHAIDIYVDMGRFSMAAKHLVTIAEIYDQSLKDMHNASIYYEKAADFYKGEESRTQANKCLLKIAEYAATNEDYQKAIKIFEEVAESCLDSNLLKYSLKEYYFKATICNLCLDVLAAKRCIDKYCDLSPHFMDSRECLLMRNIITAVEEENASSFTEHLQKYDSISRLDNWCATLLLRVKQEIEGEVDLT